MERDKNENYRDNWLDFQKVVLKNSHYATFSMFPSSGTVLDGPTKHRFVIDIYALMMVKRFIELTAVDGELIIDVSEKYLDDNELFLDDDETV